MGGAIVIAVVVQAAFGLACLIGIGVGGYKLLDHTARPEARDKAQVLVWTLMGVVTVTAFAWGIQLEARNSPLRTSWEERYCVGDVGEVIYRTVDNVPGVYYQAPSPQTSGGHFHSDDYRAEKFLSRPDRRYEFFEVRIAADALVEHYELTGGKTVASRRDAPTARYAFTWTPLESIEEANAGVHGEELEVFDRETREVLARRVLYYNQPTRRATAYGAPVQVCPQVTLRTDPAYIDGQPRDSYEFVARVLKPPAIKPEESARLFDLVRGGGRRTKECVGGYVWIGEGIVPKDLSFQKQDQDLLMTVTGTRDALLCRSYFFSFGGGEKSYRIRFADGGLVSDEEIQEQIAPTGRKKHR